MSLAPKTSGASLGPYKAALDSDHTGIECYNFCKSFATYADKSNKVGRRTAWSGLDNNGNGHVSLAETGKWIQDTLINDLKSKELGVMLYKRFYPSYIRAFLDAADYGPDKKVKGTKTATTDDYVQFNEFRLLCNYLVLYAMMFDAFAAIDGNSDGTTKDDDRRISKDEWAAKANSFSGHPFVGLGVCSDGGKGSDAVFASMDSDGKGMVLLKEFCEYIEKAEIAAGTAYGKLLAAGE